jgi:3-deoxy-D-manno-octulosonate 8-phosphate phosphatase (KDO 8-P phosphatase)
VDGVLTDGRINIASDGTQFKSYDVTDGAGIKYWMRAGRKVAIISGRACASVVLRAAELGVTSVRQNVKEKLPAYLSVLEELNVPPEKAAVMGDDLPDLPLMSHCGFPIAPANGCQEVKEAAALVTGRSGGAGAVREAVEFLLKPGGHWQRLLRRYYEDKR